MQVACAIIFLLDYIALHNVKELCSCKTRGSRTYISRFTHLTDKTDVCSCLSSLTHTFHFWWKDPESLTLGEAGLGCRALFCNSSVL